MIVKEIKEYAKMIMKIEKDKIKQIQIIDSKYIFKEWKKSFNNNYKSEKEYQKIVEINKLNDLKIDDIKNSLLKLVNNVKFKIFSEDPSKFPNMIKSIFPK